MIRRLIAAALFMVAGCTSIDITREDGTRVVITRFGYDTKIGQIDYQVADNGKSVTRSLRVDNMSSEAKAIDLAGKAMDAIGGVK